MPTLREFITSRQAQIKDQITALRDEERELKAALAAIDGVSTQPQRSAALHRMTIKEMIADVLDGKPLGGTADEIIEWVRGKHSVDVPRSSMSPQLSRLKVENVVGLRQSDKTWRLLKYQDAAPHENGGSAEPPEADAEEAEDFFGVQDPNHAHQAMKGASHVANRYITQGR